MTSRYNGRGALDHLSELKELLLADPLRMRALEVVCGLELPDCWIAAGFIRDAVWDQLHGRGRQAPAGDVDVVFHAPDAASAGLDRTLERQLEDAMPGLRWSVKNQARMHARNGDAPYRSVADAMRRWPETATAVAARIRSSRNLEIEAPLGLADMFALRLRPTLAFAGRKHSIFADRVRSKGWLERYPMLTLADDGGPLGS